MILGIGKERVGGAIHQRVDRAFRTGQEFLDHHGVARGAKDFLDHRLADGPRGFLRSLRDNDALAEGQSVGFHDERMAGRRAMGERGLGIGEGCGACRGNPVPDHEVLGERLRGLEPCGRGGGAEDTQTLGAEEIDDPHGQRIIGADHGQIDRLGLGQGDQSGQIGGGHRVVRGQGGCSRISGGAVEALHPRALGELPDQGVLAAARTDHQDIHSERMTVAEATCPDLAAMGDRVVLRNCHRVTLGDGRGLP